MFEPVKVVLNSMITWWTMIVNTLLNGMGYVGVSIIGLAILRKVVNVWRKVK